MPISFPSLQHDVPTSIPPEPKGRTTRPKLVAPPSRSTAPRTAAPGEWKPTDRWEWACGLPVSGIARAVAGCIARHANARTGLGWPGMGTIATETAFKRTAVIAAIKDLEQGGHITVTRFKVGKKNTANRYQLPPMGGAPGELGGVVDGGGGSAPHALPSAPDGLGGSASDGPESVRTESVKNNSAARARVVCEKCGHDWPASYGMWCHECHHSPSTKTPTEEPTADEPNACTCGDDYRQSHNRRCLDCNGKPSIDQLDGARKGVSQEHTLETRGQRPDNFVPQEDEIPPNGGEGEPPPKSDPDALLRWWKDSQAQYGRKQTPTTEGDTA